MSVESCEVLVKPVWLELSGEEGVGGAVESGVGGVLVCLSESEDGAEVAEVFG